MKRILNTLLKVARKCAVISILIPGFCLSCRAVDLASDGIAGDTVVITITNQNGTPIPPAYFVTITNVFGATTFTQTGPPNDTNNTYSGDYTYIKTGTNTGTIYTVKTSPPDQAGETATNYLTFDSLTNGTMIHQFEFSDSSGTQSGPFQVTVYVPRGSLQVTIDPPEAIDAGAQWQVDGGAWQNSGDLLRGFSVGNHTVTYKAVSGWSTPASQTVSITTNTTTITNGNYLLQTGSLQVTIAPPEAVSAGAQWQVDGGAWQNHSNVVSGLSVGNHTVSYKSISGWNTPSNQTVTILANLTTITNATYILQTGSLLVTITPLDAVTAGAQWRVDGGPWQNSGSVVSGLTAGNHTVSYKDIPDWYAPGQLVVVSPGSTTTANGNYVPSGLPVPPPIINCMLLGDQFTMSYLAVTGLVYIVQYTDELNPPVTWRTVGVLIGGPTGSIINFSVPTGDSPSRYFRVEVGDSLYTAVYSVNVVGYVRRTIQPGLNLVANPLNSCGGNSIGNLFQNCPQNSQILLPAPDGSLTFGSVYSGGSWDSPNLNLSPGQGVGFVNPAAAFEVTFAGEVAAGSLTNALPPGISLVSSVLPVNGLLNFPAQQGDAITTWNATNQTSVLHQYFGGAWQPAAPAISPGEAFWVQVSQSTQWTQPFEWWNDLAVWDFLIITRQPQSQARIPGTTAYFTASALSGLPLNYQWRKDGTNLFNTDRIFGVNSSTLALTNAQSGDAGNYTVVITNTYGSVTSQVAVLTVSLPPPEIITTNVSFGISNGVFGFNLTGLSGQTLVIEGSSNLIDWVALQTNMLTGDTVYFSDPQGTNYAKRFYRILSP